jgi:hypothetical protein
MTRPRRFEKATPQSGELSRWIVHASDGPAPGVVVSRRVGQSGALWLAYPDGDPERALTYDDPRQDDGGPQGKVRKFFSRREAGDALLLAEQASRARHPSAGGPR